MIVSSWVISMSIRVEQSHFKEITKVRMAMREQSLFVRCKNRCISFLFLLVALQLAGCAAQQAYNRAQEAAKREEWDRAVGQYMIALNKKPDNPSYRTGFERARLAASQF